MSAGKLNLEPLFHFPRGTVIDAIPPSERHKYYLRGASVGALALNLAYGVNRVNPRDDLFMHVTTEPTDAAHGYANSHAHSLSRGDLSPGHSLLKRAWNWPNLPVEAAFSPRRALSLVFHALPQN